VKKEWLACFAILVVAASLAKSYPQQAVPLGEYAKTLREQTHSKAAANHRFDNDNLPRETNISVIGEKPATPETAPEAEGAASTPATPGDEMAARKAAYTDWQKRIAEQKQSIELLSREVEVLKRELNLKAAQYYGNASAQLQHSAQWYKQSADDQQQIADKEKALAAAKSSLADLQEQARKAGVPAAMRD
jgi:hypothetical protein